MWTIIIVIAVFFIGKFIYDTYLTDNTDKEWEKYRQSNPQDAARIENQGQKRRQENPISEIFNDLTTNQKMSVMNLLLTIAVCDGDQGNEDKEMQYLNNYVKILNVRSDNCMSYLKAKGQQQIITDLKTISISQKEFLVLAAFEMITCDGKANETELSVTADIFDQIGVDEDKFVAVIEKTSLLMKKFYR